MRKRIQLILGTLVLIAGLGSVILAHIVSVSNFSGLAKDAISSLHAPGFGAVSVVLMLILRQNRTPLESYCYAALAATTIGFLSEAAQIDGPRNADFSDILLNSIGILGILGTTALFDEGVRCQLPSRRVIVLGLIAVPALFGTVLPTVIYGSGWIARAHAAPRLASFDGMWEKLIIGPRDEQRLQIVARPDTWPRGTGNAASLLANATNTLLFKLEPYPDWSRYTTLSFDASSSNADEQTVTLAIRDSWRRGPFRSNVFSRELRLGPDITHVQIPLDEIRRGPEAQDLDMSRISMIYILAPAPAGDESITLGSFRLE